MIRFGNFIYTILYDLTYLFIPHEYGNLPYNYHTIIWIMFTFMILARIVFGVFNFGYNKH